MIRAAAFARPLVPTGELLLDRFFRQGRWLTLWLAAALLLAGLPGVHWQPLGAALAQVQVGDDGHPAALLDKRPTFGAVVASKQHQSTKPQLKGGDDAPAATLPASHSLVAARRHAGGTTATATPHYAGHIRPQPTGPPLA
jgi:hypothetical protein